MGVLLVETRLAYRGFLTKLTHLLIMGSTRHRRKGRARFSYGDVSGSRRRTESHLGSDMLCCCAKCGVHCPHSSQEEVSHELQDRPSFGAQSRCCNCSCVHDACPSASQAHHPLCGGILRQGHSRGHDPDVCKGRRGRLHRGAVLWRDAVQAGHGIGRLAARQPGNGQCSATGYFQTDPGMVDPHFGVSVPGRRPPQRLLRQRPGHADEKDG